MAHMMYLTSLNAHSKQQIKEMDFFYFFALRSLLGPQGDGA